MTNLKKLFATIFFGLVFFCHFTASAENLDGERQVFKLLNELRAQYVVGSVIWNPESNLQTAARIRAEEISRLFSHSRPDGSDCFTAFKQAGVRYRAAGENLAMGTNLSAEKAMKLWTESPGHFQNMVDKRFGQVAIASYRAGENVYWVQLFTD